MINPDSPELAYVQLANILAAKIQAGAIKGRLPSERDLAEDYGVSPSRIYQILRAQGIHASDYQTAEMPTSLDDVISFLGTVDSEAATRIGARLTSRQQPV